MIFPMCVFFLKKTLFTATAVAADFFFILVNEKESNERARELEWGGRYAMNPLLNDDKNGKREMKNENRQHHNYRMQFQTL